MTDDELKAAVLDCLESTGFGVEDLDEMAALHDQGIDSLMMALWVVEIERRFKVRIPVTSLAGMATFADILAVVRSLAPGI